MAGARRICPSVKSSLSLSRISPESRKGYKKPPTKLQLLMKERAYNNSPSCGTLKGSGDVSATSSSSASDRSWSPRRNALEQLVDEDSANGFSRAAPLHKHGKCGIEDVDSGMGITATYISN